MSDGQQKTNKNMDMLGKRSPSKLDRLPSPPSKKHNADRAREKQRDQASAGKRSEAKQSSNVRNKSGLGGGTKTHSANTPFHKKYGRRFYEYKLPKTKHELVYEILKRWWHCLPDWPNPKEDYTAQLADLKLRIVNENFNFEPETDSKGLKKVTEPEGFQGVFIDSKGCFIDLRDKEMCPSFSNLKKKDISYLVNLLVTALEGQIAELRECTHPDAGLEIELGKLLEKVKKGYSQYAKKSGM